MKIIIKETNEVKELSIIDPNSGVDYIDDFIGNTGALNDGQFLWDDEDDAADAYICDQETFDWWDKVVSDNQALEDRIHALQQEHGYDAVHDAVMDSYANDLEDHADCVNQALDEAFGSAE